MVCCLYPVFLIWFLLWTALLSSVYVKYLEAYLGQSISEWTKWNLWKTAFKKFEMTRQIFPRLSSTNFTWSILEYFAQFMTLSNIHDGVLLLKEVAAKTCSQFFQKCSIYLFSKVLNTKPINENVCQILPLKNKHFPKYITNVLEQLFFKSHKNTPAFIFVTTCHMKTRQYLDNLYPIR